MKKMQSRDYENNDLTGLKSVLGTLLKTEKKIQDLQQFSSNDFTFINQKFLAFHKEIKSVIKEILELKSKILKHHDSIESFEISIEWMEKISTVFNNMRSGLIRKIEYYRKLNEILSLINLPLKNYRQNLFTLKLLSANFKIDITTLVKNKQISGKIDEFLVILENISLFVPKIDQHIEDYQKLTNEIIDEFNNLHSILVTIFEKELSILFELASHYRNKLSNSKIIYQDIEDKYNASLQDVETIITKLQYQDIIRQRIEHIQQTHEETVRNFKSLLNNKDSDSITDEISFQIKDIIGLQSAHLIHINKEFQRAIEIISETLKSYNQHIAELTDLSFEITNIYKNVEISFSREQNPVEKLVESITSLENGRKGMAKKITVQESQTNEFTEYFNEIFDVSAHIQRIYNTIQHITGSETLSRITALLKENLDLTSGIREKTTLFNDTYHLFQTEKIDISLELKKMADIMKSFRAVDHRNLIHEISVNSATIESELNKRKKEQEHIMIALNDLKYYQYFENNINEIIHLLDTIHSFFASYYQKDKTLGKNLEHIKNRYTTLTEHNVHEQYSSNQDFKIDELISGIESVENEDNIEFF